MAKRFEPLLLGWIGRRIVGRRIEPIDRLFWRSRRGPQRVPEIDRHSGNPGFVQRRRGRRLRPALVAHHRRGHELAGLDVRQTGTRFEAGEIDLAADQILHRWSSAEGTYCKRNPVFCAKYKPHRCAALPVPTVPNVVGSGRAFIRAISSANRFWRQRFLADDPQRRCREQRNRLQIAQDVVVQRVDGRRRDMARPLADADAVTIRNGMDDPASGDRAAGAA